MKNSKIFGTLVASAVVGVMAASPAMAKDKAKDAAYCANGCSGKSECKGHGNDSCAGKNTCSGKGWSKAKDQKECEGKGGVWKTAEAKTDAKAAAPAAPAEKAKGG